MSVKYIVVANSGEVLSTHKSLDLAEKSVKKLGGYVVETESAVKKGDLFELPTEDNVETFEAEQELAEFDAAMLNACIRISVWLRRQSDLKYAVQTLLNQ